MYKESLLSFVASTILWAMAIGLGYLGAKDQSEIVRVLFYFWSACMAIIAVAAMIASCILLSCKKENE